MSPHRFLSLAAALCATMVAFSAHAKNCTENKNIIASSISDDANRNAGGMGGHVGLHMQDAQSPLPISGARSQFGKSAFADWATFKEAFHKWDKAAGTHANCGAGGSAKDIADATSVGVTQARTCEEAGKDGICTKWKKFKPTKVCFWYANSPGAKGTDGKWLISTAYPSLNGDCS